MFKIKFKRILSLYSSNFTFCLTCIYVYLPNSDQKLVLNCQQHFQPVLSDLLHEEYFLVLSQDLLKNQLKATISQR